jgi:hypothetical protein
MSAVTASSSVFGRNARRIAWFLLVLAWLVFLLPFSGVDLYVGVPLSGAVLVFAIVSKARRGAKAGTGLLLAALLVSPLVYLLGVAIQARLAARADQADEARQRAAQEAIVNDASAPTVKVSSADLLFDYHANELAADQHYKGKRLEVTGKVESVSVDFGRPLVLLHAGELEAVYVRGLSADAASSLQINQDVTLICVGDGATLGTPSLAGCIVK